MAVRRDDFREVTPTEAEVEQISKVMVKRYGEGWSFRVSMPLRAEHIPCGKRMWYSGIGIGSHLRACRAR